MKRLLTLLLLMASLLPTTLAAAETPIADVRQAQSIEDALPFLIFPEEDLPASVQRGFFRYITQDEARDETYRKFYWLGGEEGTDLDLTLREKANGREYFFHSGVMCTRAAFSMALSYLGIDMSPGAMSALTGQRDLDPPYREVAEAVGVEVTAPKSHVFNTMMERYLTDDSYSPPYLYIEKPNGQEHAMLVIAALPETSRYLVLDSSAPWKDGEPYRIYMIALNKTRQKIVNSTFRYELYDSKVLQLYQWRLLEPEAAE